MKALRCLHGLHGLHALLAALLLCAAGEAGAHKPSDSYLAITVQGGAVTGRWDIALRDLDFAIGLDADGDGRITWGEVKARHAEMAAYAAARLQLQADGQPCTMDIGVQQVDEHTDGAYTVLPLKFNCAQASNAQSQTQPQTSPKTQPPQTLTLNYTLFADLDPQHRGLLNLLNQGATRTAILGPQAPRQTFELSGTASQLAQLLDYLREGVWHIWVGFDHILFLLSLLLPAVGVWVRRRWQEPASRSTANLSPGNWVSPVYARTRWMLFPTATSPSNSYPQRRW